MNQFKRQLPWSVLQTEWLDVPIGRDAGRPDPTWLAFSESVEVCLRGLCLHVAGCVDERALLERIVTRVFVNSLDILVSHRADRDKLDRMVAAADRLIDRGQARTGVRQANDA